MRNLVDAHTLAELLRVGLIPEAHQYLAGATQSTGINPRVTPDD